ncbi:MAG: preprotein translocase subunit SecG [Phycisphaerales bacterium]|jgi:preprotein translocase subunit SecG|nr:preprotein translocase subunit SecG [Phycisphaerales bacterium]
MSTFFLWFFFVLFILVSVLMVLIVLIQKGRGGGLSSAFGGSGGNTAFGSKTGDVLTWATSIIFGIFLLLAMVLNLMTSNTRNIPANSAPTPVQQPVPNTPATPQ